MDCRNAIRIRNPSRLANVYAEGSASGSDFQNFRIFGNGSENVGMVTVEIGEFGFVDRPVAGCSVLFEVHGKTLADEFGQKIVQTGREGLPMVALDKSCIPGILKAPV